MATLLSPGLNTTISRQSIPNCGPKDDQVNIFEITLLLKVMGFRLNYLDYQDEKDASPSKSTEMTIEIKCGKRNIVSRLSAPEDLCGCPPKREDTENESAFWEVLGTAPSSSPGGKKRVEDASSNLLRDLSKRGVANTKQLLKLIYEGFHKDHLPSTAAAALPVSPDHRPEMKPNPIHTSTVVKSPRRIVPVLNSDQLLQENLEFSPSACLTAPPNTPKVGSLAFGAFKAGSMQTNSRHKDHLVYLEVMAAKERLDKALLVMKMNIASDLSTFSPALDLTASKIFEEPPPLEEMGMSPATFQRRSSMGSFPNIKSKLDGDGKKKLAQPLVRNKSSIDTGAVTKAKSAAVTSRYLLPKKAGVEPSGVVKKSASPMAKKPSATIGKGTVAGKRPPAVGMGTRK